MNQQHGKGERNRTQRVPDVCIVAVLVGKKAHLRLMISKEIKPIALVTIVKLCVAESILVS